MDVVRHDDVVVCGRVDRNIVSGRGVLDGSGLQLRRSRVGVVNLELKAGELERNERTRCVSLSLLIQCPFDSSTHNKDLCHWERVLLRSNRGSSRIFKVEDF